MKKQIKDYFKKKLAFHRNPKNKMKVLTQMIKDYELGRSPKGKKV